MQISTEKNLNNRTNMQTLGRKYDLVTTMKRNITDFNATANHRRRAELGDENSSENV